MVTTGGEGSQVDTWGKSVTGGENSKYEGPGVPALLEEQAGQCGWRRVSRGWGEG